MDDDSNKQNTQDNGSAYGSSTFGPVEKDSGQAKKKMKKHTNSRAKLLILLILGVFLLAGAAGAAAIYVALSSPKAKIAKSFGNLIDSNSHNISVSTDNTESYGNVQFTLDPPAGNFSLILDEQSLNGSLDVRATGESYYIRASDFVDDLNSYQENSPITSEFLRSYDDVYTGILEEIDGKWIEIEDDTISNLIVDVRDVVDRVRAGLDKVEFSGDEFEIVEELESQNIGDVSAEGYRVKIDRNELIETLNPLFESLNNVDGQRLSEDSKKDVLEALESLENETDGEFDIWIDSGEKQIKKISISANEENAELSNVSFVFLGSDEGFTIEEPSEDVLSLVELYDIVSQSFTDAGMDASEFTNLIPRETVEEL